MENKMEHLFESHQFGQQYGVTKRADIFVAKALSEYQSCKFILYGAGKMMKAVLRYVTKSLKINIEVIIDKNPLNNIEEHVPILSLDEFSVYKHKNEKYCAIIAVDAYGREQQITKEIDEFLAKEGIYGILTVTDLVDRFTKVDWYNYFLLNRDAFCNCIRIYQDEISRDTYYEYFRCYLEGHRYLGKTYAENDKYFLLHDADKEIIHLEDEVWINLGAYVGDTIFLFLYHKFPFKKIYAVEIDTDTSKLLRKNISYLPEEQQSRIELVEHYFSDQPSYTSMDEYFKNEKITFINMDIEGSEMEVLLSSKNIISRNRPVLAICVYHKKDDLLTIPNLIHNLVDDYSFFLRKYPSCLTGGIDSYFEAGEFVFYAVPNERLG